MLRAISSSAGILKSLATELPHRLPGLSLRSLATVKPGIKPIELVEPILADEAPTSCKLIYDGSCPACRMTVKGLNIKDAELINARKAGDPTVRALEAKGYNFDKGMALIETDGTIHFGADAVAAMGEKKGGLYKTILGSDIVRNNYSFLRGVRDALVPESIAEQRAREAALELTKPTLK